MDYLCEKSCSLCNSVFACLIRGGHLLLNIYAMVWVVEEVSVEENMAILGLDRRRLNNR